MIDLTQRLISKSIEAFTMSIEIYNKPTIKYRVEGFSFFICNAWELMLKAHIIDKYGSNKIYYDDNPGRTISLEKCIQMVFTNDKAPLRVNLEKVIELRNTSTHFITEEYEMVYIPLFQACLLNFVDKMQQFHKIDMTEVIPQNFITLAISMKALDENVIRAKYPEEIANKIISTNSAISPMVDENNSNFAIRIEHLHFITKDKGEATSFVNVSKDAEATAKIIKELKDPNDTHKYTMKKCIEQINRKLAKDNIAFCSKSEQNCFNSYHFGLFCAYFNLKNNSHYCYIYKAHAQPSYSYSMATIDFIVDEIKKDPQNIIENLKKNKPTPGAKEF